MFCAMRAALKNTVHKMWKCAASVEGLNELVSLVTYELT
jgi:hypothetical protein